MKHLRCVRRRGPSAAEDELRVKKGRKMGVGETYDLVGVHNRLQAMRHCEQGDVLAELGAEGRLDDCVRLVVCPPESASEPTTPD